MNKVTIEGFSITGVSIRSNNALEASSSRKIPALWEQFYGLKTAPRQKVYGVYSDYESDAAGEFTVTVGTRNLSSSTTNITAIKSGTYLAFPADGLRPAAIIHTWFAVWEHFSQTRPYTRSYETDFEEYTGKDSAIIYIGIKLKS